MYRGIIIRIAISFNQVLGFWLRFILKNFILLISAVFLILLNKL
jgi:hypothetical protein